MRPHSSIPMTKYLSRREFVAAVVAGNAMAAFGLGRPPLHAAQRRMSIPPQVGPEPRLWLPTGSGQGASVKFANSPDWVRNTPGWFIPSTVSAGACMLDFPLITFLPTLIHNFRDLPSLLDQARSLGTSTIYLVDWFEGKAGTRRDNYWTFKGDYKPR